MFLLFSFVMMLRIMALLETYLIIYFQSPISKLKKKDNIKETHLDSNWCRQVEQKGFYWTISSFSKHNPILSDVYISISFRIQYPSISTSLLFFLGANRFNGYAQQGEMITMTSQIWKPRKKRMLFWKRNHVVRFFRGYTIFL